ncbi:MAG: protein kinase domain-containing protein, partial [Terriglobales bacterium]
GEECHMSNEAPKRLGDYKILKVLGAGGMGRVYQVRNVITDRIEAMKVLLPEISGQEEVAARFLREIKVLAALNHPHIASLHTALSIDNQLVMIMEYVEGQSISNLLSSGAIPVPEALTYIDQVLDALSYAHARKVVHRDIKPANIMLTPSGTVKLMDFGIARTENEPTLTAPGSTLGSMNYMSPEQVKGEATDERSDLYSLGISLYEMVIGDRPFHGDSSFSLMSAHLSQPPTPPIDLLPAMPPGLNDIILTSIAKEPAARFQSADAFRNAVQAVLRELQESKTMFQGSRDTTATGVRAPQPQVRTGPITRPRPGAPVSHTAPTAPTPVPVAVAPPVATVAAAPAVAVTPVAQPAPPPPPPFGAPMTVPPVAAAARSGNRGLWVALGAVAVLIVLVAAGLYIPRSRKAAAADDGKSSTPIVAKTDNPAPPQPTPVVEKPQPPVEVLKPAEAAPKTAVKKLVAEQSAGNAAAAQAAAAQAAAAKQKQQEMDAVEKDVDQLTGRAASVNASLETLQRQQAAMGLGLRGDISAKLGSMRLNLAKAQDAVTHGDVERAKRYAALATSDVEALETFLGR